MGLETPAASVQEDDEFPRGTFATSFSNLVTRIHSLFYT